MQLHAPTNRSSPVIAFCLSTALTCLLLSGLGPLRAQSLRDDAPTDSPDGHPDGCTTIAVGRNASAGGWVSTSHICDSHCTLSSLEIVPARRHPRGSLVTMRMRANHDSLAMPSYRYVPVGQIPQVEHTHGYINTAYPCMNDQQLAVGESTFGGRRPCVRRRASLTARSWCD